MKLKKVLVVFKKSSYDLYRDHGDMHFIRALKAKHITVSRFLPSHNAHHQSLNTVKKIVQSFGAEADFIDRAQPFNDRKYDLIITVGGDGTFLETSHHVTNTPMLGVNSSPVDSVGIFCGATAKTLKAVLKEIVSGKRKPIPLRRISAKLNGRDLKTPILNDILVTHASPAATSRYVLGYQGKKEEQKSSGVWFCTPAGSTAATGTAGGKFMPISSRNFQFRVRELYRPPGLRFRMAMGLVPGGRKMTIMSKMRVGRVFLDGPHRALEFPFGAKLEISLSAPPVRAYAFNEKRRKQFKR